MTRCLPNVAPFPTILWAWPDRHLGKSSTSYLLSHLFKCRFPAVIAKEMNPPQRILFPPENICMDWLHTRRPGPGLRNLGSTCYVNVILQCLTYTPPLANYLLSRQHSQSCRQQVFCMMCIMEDHVRKIMYSLANAILPRAVLRSLRFVCLRCQAVSDSYKAFLEVLLKIKAASSLTTILENFVKPRLLDGRQCMKCSRYRKKMIASKKITIHHAPRVLTLCLGRVDVRSSRKISQVVEYPECLDLQPYMSEAAGEPLLYSLYAVVVHSGETCLAGHFFCYIKASDGLWYKMDDETMDDCDIHAVLGQQAYLLFYIRCPDLEMEEMATSSSAPPYAHSFLSEGGGSSKQVDSARQQDLPGRNKALGQSVEIGCEGYLCDGILEAVGLQDSQPYLYFGMSREITRSFLIGFVNSLSLVGFRPKEIWIPREKDGISFPRMYGDRDEIGPSIVIDGIF
ncbi:ubiquitin carboxyl-terminal hydrolase 42-like protein [Pitangus sulphuratus]|nr:ubiquitin carboxyl-terminal hydrolase 42-like protein [Pitangus sulphuratus]